MLAGAAQDLFRMEKGVHALKVMVADPYRAQAVARVLAVRLGPA